MNEKEAIEREEGLDIKEEMCKLGVLFFLRKEKKKKQSEKKRKKQKNRKMVGSNEDLL